MMGMRVNQIELPIRRAVGRVVMKPHQVRRDARRGGKTSQAAARLAHYRLRKWLRGEGWMMVDDVELVVEDNVFIRDQRTVLTTVRCVDRLTCEMHGISNFRVPSGTSVVKIAIPVNEWEW